MQRNLVDLTVLSCELVLVLDGLAFALLFAGDAAVDSGFHLCASVNRLLFRMRLGFEVTFCFLLVDRPQLISVAFRAQTFFAPFPLWPQSGQ